MKRFGKGLEFVYRRLPEILISLGAVIRVREWLGNRSLWLDEAYLGLHLMKQGWIEILRNIRFVPDFPVPPMGFMLVQKINTEMFGHNEMALRLFPLLCGVAAMFLFYALAKKLLSFPVAIGILALFVFNDVLIEYSCELKQYSTDLFVLLALSALFVFQTDKDFVIKQKDLFLFSVAGMFAVTFSHPAVFVLASFGAVQQIRLISQKRFQEALTGCVAGILWLVVFMFWYKASYSQMSAEPQLIEAVKKGGFMLSFSLWSAAGWGWLAGKGMDILGNVALLRPVGLSIPLFFLGLPLFFRKNFKMAVLFVMPLVIAFLAGAAGKYLLGGRFSIFMVPAILLCLGMAADYLIARFGVKGKAVVLMCFVIFFLGMVERTGKHIVSVRQKQETRELARILQAEFQADDALIVNNSGYIAMWYYLGQNGGFQIPVIYCVTDDVFVKEQGPPTVFFVRTRLRFDQKGLFDGFPNQDIEPMGDFTLEKDLDFEGVRRIWFFGGHMKGSEEFVLAYFIKRGKAPAIHLNAPGARLMMFEVGR